MAADIMRLPVKRPESSEAAAMGGAIQALWCLLKLNGAAADIAALADEHIAIREDEINLPNEENAARYDAAYAEYNRYLDALSPLYG
jgi:xylulokinase